MGPKVGNLVEHVRNSGKVIYARIVRIEGVGVNRIFICKTTHGNLLSLNRGDFRIVKCMAGSSEESFNHIFR